jgi:hypothetical protein
MFAIFSGLIPNFSKTEMATSEIFSTLAGFIIIVSLTIFWLRNGIKKVKKEKELEIITFSEKLDINFVGQLTYKDYRNLIFGLTFKKPVYYIIAGLLILLSLSFITSKVGLGEHQQMEYIILVFLLIFSLSPLLILTQTKKQYQTNKIFSEKLDYQLNNDFIHIKGKNVESTQNWTHFYKIKETKGFFMLYQGNLIATLLDKKQINETDILVFRKFIKSLKIIRE